MNRFRSESHSQNQHNNNSKPIILSQQSDFFQQKETVNQHPREALTKHKKSTSQPDLPQISSVPKFRFRSIESKPLRWKRLGCLNSSSFLDRLIGMKKIHSQVSHKSSMSSVILLVCL
jgi:hypothetical protein